MLPEDKIEEILNGIFEGTIDVANLPEDLYLATAKYLEGGLYKGYGAKLDASMYYQPDYELLSELRDNVYIFSGAKTYQQVRDMSGLIAKTKTFSEFQREARKVYDEYNKNWLKAEYQTTIGQGQMANLWNQIEQTKDIFPYLEYKAVIDSKTSEICRPLDGVILKVEDPFWNKYTPLNHFNCRCTVKKLDKYTDKLTTNPSKLKEIEGEVSGQVPDEFKMNVGKDGYVFNPKEHPYFKVAPKDKGLAKNNFGLPIPEVPDLYKNIELKNEEELMKSSGLNKAKIHELYQLSGIPPEIKGNVDIKYFKDNEKARITFEGEGVTMTRLVLIEKNYIDNEYFKIKKGSKYKGKGAEIFARQVEYAAKAKYEYIKTLAAGDGARLGMPGSYNGYYTWARLGYVPRPEDVSRSIDLFNQTYGTNAKNLQELISTKTGQEFWKNKGKGFIGKFELKENSYSRKTLKNYLDAKSK